MSQVDGYELYACPDCGSSLYDPSSGCSHCANKPATESRKATSAARYSFEASPPTPQVDVDEWLRVMLYRSSGSTYQRENNIYRQLADTLVASLADVQIPAEARRSLILMTHLGTYAERQREAAKAEQRRQDANQLRLATQRKSKYPDTLGLENAGHIRCHLCGKHYPKGKFARHLKKRHSIVWNRGK